LVPHLVFTFVKDAFHTFVRGGFRTSEAVSITTGSPLRLQTAGLTPAPQPPSRHQNHHGIPVTPESWTASSAHRDLLHLATIPASIVPPPSLFPWDHHPNGMIATMSDAPLTGTVALLSDAPLEELIGVVEVLAQEGVANLSMPVDSASLEELVALYGQRIRIGVHGAVKAPATLATQGADFILPDFVTSDIATIAEALALACYATAMTPTEVATALTMPVTGVQLRPAEVVGPTMAEHLQRMGLIDKTIPRGGLIPFTAKQWLSAGAPAVCVGRHLIGDALKGGDLAALRDRCRNLRN
jgi:hypothetical protein